MKHNPTNTIVCKAHGEWNGTLEFTYNNGETKVIDTTALPVYPKKIRPLEKQGPMESRWVQASLSLALEPRGREEAFESSANGNHVLTPLDIDLSSVCRFEVDPLSFPVLFCICGVVSRQVAPS